MPLTDYLTAPRRTAGFRQGLGPVRTPGGELRQWAHQVVEKVRVASVGGRLRFLPWYDPYTDESPEMRREYRTMLREPTIKAAVQTKILSVISEELQFQPDNPEDPREKEVATFCKYAFGKLRGGIRELGWSVLHPALIDGVSICEKVRRVDPLPGGRFKGKRIYDKIKPKDSHFLQLGIDPFRNITAIRGTGFNAGKVYSPSDFIIFSYFPLYANPSGLSDFRAAYRAYWIKDTAWKLRSLHLENFTGPFLIGHYPKEDIAQKAALQEAFAEARADTWLTIPVGAMIETLDLSMKGTADFKDSIADCDKEMLIAIVGAHLQNLEGQSGSGRHGDTKVHREIGELIQWWLAATLADVYQAQLVVPLVEENYHDVEPPDVTVGAVTDEDMLQKAQVYKALQETGMELSRKEAYQTFSMSQPEIPEDILRPPGQGGGAGGAPPSPSSWPRLAALPGEDGGSPNASFAEGDVHGPKPPGPGWVQVGTGPRGGKVWRREKGDRLAALPPARQEAAPAAAPARPVSAEQAAAVKDAFEEMTLYGEVRRDGIMRVDQARSVFNGKTGLDLSPAEFAGFLEDAHKAHALRLQIENHVNDAAKEPGYAATMPHFGDVAYGYVEPPRTEAGMERLAAFAREYAAGARQVRAGNTLAAEVARAGGSKGGGGGRRPFGEARAFCQEGENKGKPGPCPEDVRAERHVRTAGGGTLRDDSYSNKVRGAGGQEINIIAREHETGGLFRKKGKSWEVMFGATGEGGETVKATGQAGGEAVRIMRDVGRSVEDFIAHARPESFHFSASRFERSRVRLYDRLAQKLARQHGYELRRRGGLAEITYTFTKPAVHSEGGHASFCQEGPNKGKPGPCPKPKQTTVAPARQPKATAEEAHAHIERVRQNPTPEGVKAVAETLARMTVKDVAALKQRLGIRAGGPKAALVQKVAHEATRRLGVRERYVREARALGYSVKDLTSTATRHRQVYNEVVDEAGRVLRDARSQYAQFTGGGRLHRGMRAFKSGDWTEVPHFDQISESLQRRYPDLLPGDAQEGYERLFTMLQAGGPARMKYETSYEKAMEELQTHGPQERRRRPRQTVPPEEEIPFAEGGADPDRLDAILEAMLDAVGDPDRLAVLAELAAETDEAGPADDDPEPPAPDAQARVAGWLDEIAARRRREEGWAAFCQEGENRGKPGPCPEEIEGHHAAADAHHKEARAAHKEAAKHARAAAATTERKTGNPRRDVPPWASKPLNEVQQLAGGGAKKPSPENLRQAVARADELLPQLEALAGANPAAARAAKAVRASRVAAQKALDSYAAAGQSRRAARLAQAGREGPHEAAVDTHAATLTAGDDWTTILEGDLSGPDVNALGKALDDVQDAHAHDELPALRDAALRARKAGAAVAAAHAGQAEHAPSVAAARRLALAASRLVPALDELAAARAGRK